MVPSHQVGLSFVPVTEVRRLSISVSVLVHWRRLLTEMCSCGMLCFLSPANERSSLLVKRILSEVLSNTYSGRYFDSVDWVRGMVSIDLDISLSTWLYTLGNTVSLLLVNANCATSSSDRSKIVDHCVPPLFPWMSSSLPFDWWKPFHCLLWQSIVLHLMQMSQPSQMLYFYVILQCFVSYLASLLVTLSFHELPSIFFCSFWWVASNLFSFTAVISHVSASYSSVEIKSAL